MRYEVLGSLRMLDDDGAVVPISAPKMECVLAALLVRSNQVVSTKQLITETWGECPPQRATAGIHVYISQLRKLFDRADGTPTPILTRAPGYLLRVGSDELDSIMFHQLVQRGRSHLRRKRYEEACASFEDALALWRGPALGQLRDGPIVHGFVAWLEELRLECMEMCVESSLMLGRHRELVSVLYGLVAEYPLNEAFYRQLMYALYRSERRADALNVYHQARETLSRELGLEPGPMLRELQHKVLTTGGEHRVRAAV